MTEQSTSSLNTLTLNWTFGLNKDLSTGIHNLVDNTRKIIFYTSAHTGVLYDYINGKQILLQGHSNEISATSVSVDKRFIVTCDKGPSNALIIVWDTLPHFGERPVSAGPPSSSIQGGVALPIKTIFDPNDGFGIVDVEFSSDGKYFVAIGNEPDQQTLNIWDWTTESNKPITSIKIEGGPQIFVSVNPDKHTEFMTNGKNSTNFYLWDKDSNTIKQYQPVLSSKDFKNVPSAFTSSTFIPGTSLALSATADGDVVVWGDRSLNNLSVKLQKGVKAAVKYVKLHHSAINCIITYDKKFIITGGEDGTVKVYDLQFRLVHWFERIKAGPISSLSFTSTASQPHVDTINTDQLNVNDVQQIESDLSDQIPEFFVCTKHAKVIYVSRNDAQLLSNTANSTIEKDRRISRISLVENPSLPTPAVTADSGAVVRSLKTLFESQFDKVCALSSHPNKTRFVVAGYSGIIHLWDYSTKTLIATRKLEEIPHSLAKKAKIPVIPAAAESEAKDVEPKGKTKEVHTSKLRSNKIQSIAFSPCGNLIAIGTLDGTIKLINSEKLHDIDQPNTWNISAKASISNLTFSSDSTHLAASDSKFGVSLFRLMEITNRQQPPVLPVFAAPLMPIHSQYPPVVGGVDGNVEGIKKQTKINTLQWVFVGRCQAHYGAINGLLFLNNGKVEQTEEQQPEISQVNTSNPEKNKNQPTEPKDITKFLRLLSFSVDRHVVEYDVVNASITKGFQQKMSKKIEQIAYPLAVSLYPKTTSTSYPSSEDEEAFILTFNSEYKFRILNSTTMLCRRTVLGPTYGGNINSLQVVPSSTTYPKYLAFSTREKAIGVLKLPMDGNPHRAMGVIAHPGNISNLCCTFDGQYILTAGSDDSTVNMWSINPSALDAQITYGGEGMEPFLNMLENTCISSTVDSNGQETSVYKEMEDYFYYAQLRSQGEDITDQRQITEYVNIKEVPLIMQAMGYYPTQQEIENIINEIKFSEIERTGDIITKIKFNDLIKIYLNHRPVSDLSQDEVELILGHAKKLGNQGDVNDPVRRIPLNTVLTSDSILSLVQQFGETMSTEEYNDSFKSLLTEVSPYFGDLPQKFTAKEFLEDILGFLPISIPEVKPANKTRMDNGNNRSEQTSSAGSSSGGGGGFGLFSITNTSSESSRSNSAKSDVKKHV
ncbi:Cilia- and flagella-associated protein 251 [Nowakowskiella sp. JEL0407]|nr:Cilia- and flagella-associated protein 251 [Nowakowskiella sp. JEL0407]